MSLLDPRLIQRDKDTGATDYYHYDVHTGGFTVEHVADVEPVIEENKLIANAASRDWKGDLKHVARIPLVILDQLRKAGILRDPKRYRAWLNDPDNRVFRTHEGRV